MRMDRKGGHRQAIARSFVLRGGGPGYTVSGAGDDPARRVIDALAQRRRQPEKLHVRQTGPGAIGACQREKLHERRATRRGVGNSKSYTAASTRSCRGAPTRKVTPTAFEILNPANTAFRFLISTRKVTSSTLLSSAANSKSCAPTPAPALTSSTRKVCSRGAWLVMHECGLESFRNAQPSRLWK